MSEFLLQNAQRLHQAGNLKEAARLYGEALKLNPRHSRRFMHWAICTFSRRNSARPSGLSAKRFKSIHARLKPTSFEDARCSA